MSGRREVKYLEYRKAGEIRRNAGYLKWICRGELCDIVIQISGVPEKGGRMPIYLLGDNRQHMIGNVDLAGGNGTAVFRGMNTENVDGSGISADGIREVRIELGEHDFVFCRWSREKEEEQREVLIEPAQKTALASEPEKENSSAEENIREKHEPSEVRRTEAPSEETVQEGAGRKELNAADAGEKCRPVSGQELYALQSAMKTEKWEQLQAIYPHIAPFGDEREYLKITPGDFVILDQKSYKAANNSFLLHGYFSYKHLILHRIRKRGEYLYYIGVPGKYFEKEKEVAILFGFECFEGENLTVREGEEGYYMLRVEL